MRNIIILMTIFVLLGCSKGELNSRKMELTVQNKSIPVNNYEIEKIVTGTNWKVYLWIDKNAGSYQYLISSIDFNSYNIQSGSRQGGVAIKPGDPVPAPNNDFPSDVVYGTISIESDILNGTATSQKGSSLIFTNL